MKQAHVQRPTTVGKKHIGIHGEETRPKSCPNTMEMKRTSERSQMWRQDQEGRCMAEEDE